MPDQPSDPRNAASACPNGPDEQGVWPCDPIENGDGTATCSECNWTGRLAHRVASRERDAACTCPRHSGQPYSGDCPVHPSATSAGVWFNPLLAAEGLRQVLAEIPREEYESCHAILDWIGVARDTGVVPPYRSEPESLSLAERVRLLAVELATRQGYSLDEAERLCPEAKP